MARRNRVSWLLRRVKVRHHKVCRTVFNWHVGRNEPPRWEEQEQYERTLVCRLCGKQSIYAAKMGRHLRDVHYMPNHWEYGHYLRKIEGTHKEKFNADDLGTGE